MSSRHGPRSGGNNLGDLDVHAASQTGAPGREARGGVEIVGFDDNIAAQHGGAWVAAVRGRQDASGPGPVTPISDPLPERAEPCAPRPVLVGGRSATRLATESNDVLAHGNSPFGSGRRRRP